MRRKLYARIKAWLAPPVFPDDQAKTAQARLMNTMGLYFVLLLTIALLIYVPLFTRHKVESGAIVLAMFGLYAIARYLLYRGELFFASLFMVVSGWLVCEVLAYLGGGISSPIMFALVAITSAVGLLFPPRFAVLFLALSISSGLGFAVLQQNGVVLPQFFIHSPLGTWAVFSLSLVFINLIISLTVRKLKITLALARQQNNALQQADATLRASNAELEALIDDRKTIEHSLRQRNQEMATLYETSLEISRLFDLAALLDAIVRRACALLNLSSGSLYLLRVDEQVLEMVVEYHLPSHWVGKKIRIGDGVAGRVVQTRQPFIVEDYQTWEGRLDSFDNTPARRTLGIPILIHEDVIGVLVLIGDEAGTFADDAVRLVSLFAAQAAIAIENAHLYEQVRQMAITDTLTGLFNRSFFDAELARVEQGRDYPISIVMADLDNMKATNDTLGHAKGDELLKRMAGALRHAFRSADIIARIGGDEFAVLLPNTDAAMASQMLARVHHTLLEFNRQNPALPIQASLGAATAEHGGLMDVFTAADQDMYVDKARRKAG